MRLDPGPLAAALVAHGRVARVVVASVRGSAPREAGTAMLVWEGGQHGTIGGGTLEWEAARLARAALAEGSAPFARRHALGPDLGQCCGGAVVLVTEVLDAVPEGQVRAIRVEGDAPRPAASGWRDGWLVEAVGVDRAPLWVWGAGHVGRAVADVLAPSETFAIWWADFDAARFPERIPAGVERVVAADLPALAAHAPRDAHHLILTHSHDLDLALCDALLRRGFASCGLIGSDTKRARFASRLRKMGHADPFGRIRCPIGAPDLGRAPQAIAIGVAAELLRMDLAASDGQAPARQEAPAA